MTLRKALTLALALAALTMLAVLPWPGDPKRARWDGYLDRLARLSRQAVPPAAPLDLRPYPGNAAPRRPLPDLRAGLQRALRHHTDRWQDLMGACGLMPGGEKTGTDTY
ncbi:hypothetical protein ACLD0W_13510 [Alloalcanivorax sp. C16-1]|uniref:hypothetical protein n=1 Tax=Alloalcanivorax sp. C16-1 TaxID=3390051 RepID=UPI003970543A